jgi:hypothetical protein
MIYVILINGEPYTKDGAIRTYKTRENAARQIVPMTEIDTRWASSGRSRKRRYEVGVFSAVDLEVIS